MNPKIALFLSTTLTAFVVATLSGVVNKVTSVSALDPTPAVVQQVATATLEQPTDQPTDLPTATTVSSPDPMQAATLASQAINRQDVYSVETFAYKGVDAYKVVFSSGDVVYIGMDGQVLEKTKLKAVVANVQATTPPKKRNRNNDGNSQPHNNQPSNNGGNNGGGEHEEGGE